MKSLLLALVLFAPAVSHAADPLADGVEKGVTPASTFCDVWVDYGANTVAVDCDGKNIARAGFDTNGAASLQLSRAVSLVMKKGLKVVNCAYGNADRSTTATELCYLARQ